MVLSSSEVTCLGEGASSLETLEGEGTAGSVSQVAVVAASGVERLWGEACREGQVVEGGTCWQGVAEALPSSRESVCILNKKK